MCFSVPPTDYQTILYDVFQCSAYWLYQTTLYDVFQCSPYRLYQTIQYDVFQCSTYWLYQTTLYDVFQCSTYRLYQTIQYDVFQCSTYWLYQTTMNAVSVFQLLTLWFQLNTSTILVLEVLKATSSLAITQSLADGNLLNKIACLLRKRPLLIHSTSHPRKASS